MTSSEKRMLLPILRKLANHEKLNHRAQSAAEQLYARLTRKSEKKIAAKVRQRSEKQSARASHNQETAKIREALYGRSLGRCEVRGCHDDRTELDHWLGGSGRRRAAQAYETCWLLCQTHHVARTLNCPSAEWWNEEFKAHCAKYGLAFTPHIIHAEPAKAGGAP